MAAQGIRPRTCSVRTGFPDLPSLRRFICLVRSAGQEARSRRTRCRTVEQPLDEPRHLEQPRVVVHFWRWLGLITASGLGLRVFVVVISRHEKVSGDGDRVVGPGQSERSRSLVRKSIYPTSRRSPSAWLGDRAHRVGMAWSAQLVLPADPGVRYRLRHRVAGRTLCQTSCWRPCRPLCRGHRCGVCRVVGL